MQHFLGRMAAREDPGGIRNLGECVAHARVACDLGSLYCGLLGFWQRSCEVVQKEDGMAVENIGGTASKVPRLLCKRCQYLFCCG